MKENRIKNAIQLDASSTTPRKLLLIEDSPTMRAVCVDMLQKVGLQIDAVGTAEEAWANLSVMISSEYDSAKAFTGYSAVLLDWILPQMSGEELLRKIHKARELKDVAVMIFTESPDDSVWELVLARSNTDIQLKDELQLLPQRMLKFISTVEEKTVSQAMEDLDADMQKKRALETILLVDDSKTVLVRYSSLLKEAGYNVIEANGYHDGLAKAVEHKPSLAIIDFCMPDGNGDELCKVIIANNASDAIVMFSQRKDVTEIALEVGALDLLFKDDPAHLFLMRINAIMHVIRSRRMSNQFDLLLWSTEAFGFGIMRRTPNGLRAENPVMKTYQKEANSLEIFDTEATFESPLEVVGISGKIFYFAVQRYPFDAQDDVIVAQDITMMKTAEREIEIAKESAVAAKQQMEVLLNSAGEGVLGISSNGSIDFANPKACSILCIDHDELLKRKIQSFFILSEDDVQSLDDFLHEHEKMPKGLLEDWNKYQIARLLSQEKGDEGLHNYWRTEDGETIYVEYTCNPTLDADNQYVGAVVMFQDISERKQLEDKLVNLANFDPLTGLANRAHFHVSLTEALERQKRSDKTLAILYLDMDHFKYINDSLGHDAGDDVLLKAANKLRDSVRASDLVARLGGDEFAVALYNIEGPADASMVARKILATLTDPLDILSSQVNISFSIGIAMLTDELNTLGELLKAADTAMYAAKQGGRNNFKHYEPSMQLATQEKQRIQRMLQQAIALDEFRLLYQPKVSLATKKMTGCEALLRWHPTHEDEISPAIFIPHAEESGQVIEIGEWVLKTACRQVKSWLALPHFKGLTVSINVSVRQLGRKAFFPLIKQELEINGIPPSAIEIEITETGVMEDIENVIDELKAIHDLGISIAIDDFGTGNSSLEMLRKLPLDSLKIDRSFVKDITHNKQDEELIRVMLAVAKTLGLEVIAEGVETPEQMLFLSKANCELIQGYFFSKPVTPEVFEQLVSQHTNAFYKQFSRYEQSLLSAIVDGPTEEIIEEQDEATTRILICDGDLNFCYRLQNLLEENSYVVDIATTAQECLVMLDKKRYQLLALEPNLGNLENIQLVEAIRERHTEDELRIFIITSSEMSAKEKQLYRPFGIARWLPKSSDDRVFVDSLQMIMTCEHMVGLPIVLHVEDLEDQRDLVSKSLQGIAQVIPAADLASARTAMERIAFDVILLDDELPDGSGNELLDTIDDLSDPPQVFLLAVADLEQAFIDRVSGTLEKSPESYNQLNQVIISALQRRMSNMNHQQI